MVVVRVGPRGKRVSKLYNRVKTEVGNSVIKIKVRINMFRGFSPNASELVSYIVERDASMPWNPVNVNSAIVKFRVVADSFT